MLASHSHLVDVIQIDHSQQSFCFSNDINNCPLGNPFPLNKSPLTGPLSWMYHGITRVAKEEMMEEESAMHDNGKRQKTCPVTWRRKLKAARLMGAAFAESWSC